MAVPFAAVNVQGRHRDAVQIRTKTTDEVASAANLPLKSPVGALNAKSGAGLPLHRIEKSL